MKKNILLICLFFLIGVMVYPQTADELIDKIDETRGPGFSFSCDVAMTTMEKKEVTEKNLMRLLYKRQNDGANRAFGYMLEPEDQKGRKLLLIGTDTWLYIPGSKKPIKISPAQKLSGNTSTGDILSVNYKADYTPTIIGEEKISDINTIKLELIAKTPTVTYYKIVIFVNKNDFKPVKSEFYSKTEKLLKSGFYRKYQKIGGKNICIEILIVDNIMKEN
ncbi:MAG TPA: outer membrane lipoprotein-sorting protein, partial [Spirochaetota bacterium]|nr:outer membrane lipoprotein-sorting protein [Spirochaetota bacterium]